MSNLFIGLSYDLDAIVIAIRETSTPDSMIEAPLEKAVEIWRALGLAIRALNKAQESGLAPLQGVDLEDADPELENEVTPQDEGEAISELRTIWQAPPEDKAA